jgi:hypothetical protein
MYCVYSSASGSENENSQFFSPRGSNEFYFYYFVRVLYMSVYEACDKTRQSTAVIRRVSFARHISDTQPIGEAEASHPYRLISCL